MTQAKCILFSGLPGSGKTSLARQLATRLQISLFSKDAIDRVLRDDGLIENSSLTGYHLLMDLAEQQLSLHLSTILDAVFPMQGFRKEVSSIVQKQDARLIVIHTYCSDSNTHRQRMTNRVQYHQGWTPKGWEEVERLASFYEAWEQDEAIFVDAIYPINENFEKILNIILSK